MLSSIKIFWIPTIRLIVYFNCIFKNCKGYKIFSFNVNNILINKIKSLLCKIHII